MTFFMIGGIVATFVGVILIFIYLVAHRLDDNSTAAKILCWLGMMFGVAGAALMTIEYSFPNISHPKQPSVYDHFVEYLGDHHITYMEHELGYEVDNVINVRHTEIYSYEEDGMYLKLYDTTIIYSYDSEPWKYQMVNKYEYNKDYSYQNLVHYSYGGN